MPLGGYRGARRQKCITPVKWKHKLYMQLYLPETTIWLRSPQWWSHHQFCSRIRLC